MRGVYLHGSGRCFSVLGLLGLGGGGLGNVSHRRGAVTGDLVLHKAGVGDEDIPHRGHMVPFFELRRGACCSVVKIGFIAGGAETADALGRGLKD